MAPPPLMANVIKFPHFFRRPPKVPINRKLSDRFRKLSKTVKSLGHEACSSLFWVLRFSYQKKVSVWAPKKLDMIPQNWKISCVGIGQNFHLSTQWKTHKPTKFCIALWFRFVCLFWHSFLTKFPIVNIVVLTIFLICIRWDMNVEIWYIVLVRNGGCWSIAGKELWVNAWYVVIKTFHIPSPPPPPRDSLQAKKESEI